MIFLHRIKRKLLKDEVFNNENSNLKIMITAAWKAEEINLVCEILKKNFKQPVEIHLFSNASKVAFSKMHPVLEWDLIDVLHLWSEEKAEPSIGGSTGRRTTEQKRIRSIRFVRQWARMLKTIGGIGGEWIILECDHIPLNEEAFYAPLKALKKYEIVCNIFDLSKCNPEKFPGHEENLIATKWRGLAENKIREGFLEPGCLYVRSEFAYQFGRKLDEINERLSNTGLVGESVMAKAIKLLAPKQSNYSSFLMHDQLTQIDPVNSVIHSHSILNLASWFKKFGIKNGFWVEKVLCQSAFKRCVDDLEVLLQGEPVLGNMNLEICNGAVQRVLNLKRL